MTWQFKGRSHNEIRFRWVLLYKRNRVLKALYRGALACGGRLARVLLTAEVSPNYCTRCNDCSKAMLEKNFSGLAKGIVEVHNTRAGFERYVLVVSTRLG